MARRARNNAKMSAASRKRMKEAAEKMSAGLELNELRELVGVTQVDMSSRLKTTQAAVSRLEHRKNTRLFTLQRYLEVLGAELELRAVFPDRTIKLNHVARRRTKPS